VSGSGSAVGAHGAKYTCWATPMTTVDALRHAAYRERYQPAKRCGATPAEIDIAGRRTEGIQVLTGNE
jgi:hypothetical protein